MIVLDEVEAAARQLKGEFAESVGAEALRLQGGAGQRPALRAETRAQARKAMGGTSEAGHKLIGQNGVDEDHVVMQRSVAEQHIYELAGVASDGGGGEFYADVEAALARRADRRHAPDDVGEDARLGDGAERHLDALLHRDGLGPRLDRVRRRADPVDGGHSRRHESLLYHRRQGRPS